MDTGGRGIHDLYDRLTTEDDEDGQPSIDLRSPDYQPEVTVPDIHPSDGPLDLTEVPGAVSPQNFRGKPWRRVSATPSARHLSKRCPPPARALSR